MKTPRLTMFMKSAFLGLLTIMIILPLTSSAKKIPFLTSTVAPAARGYIKINKDSNKNFTIQVNVEDLAVIERIQPTQQTYVVWMVNDRNETENIGRIISSKNLSGFMKTVSSSQPIKIFITAEKDESVQYPGDMIVLTTDNFWE